MATDLERLIVQLEAQTDKFNKALAKAEGTAVASTNRIQKRFEAMNPNITRSLTRLAGVLGIGLGGLGLDALARSAIKAVEEVGKIADVADRVGVSTTAFQSLQFALRQSGGSAEDAEQALQRFADGMVEASKGSGALNDWLKANNVALRDAAGNLRNTGAVLNDVATLIRNARSPQEALNLSIDAFGRRAGPAMAAALREAKGGLADWEDQAKSAGVVMDENLIRKAKQINDEWDKLSTVFGVKVKGALIQVIEQMEKLGQRTAILMAEQRELAATLPSLGDMEFPRPPDELPQRLSAIDAQVQEVTEGWLALGRAQQAYFAGGTTSESGTPTGTPTKTPTGTVQKNELERAIDATNRRIASLQAEAATIGQTVFEQEKYRVQLELEERAKLANIPVTKELRKDIDAVAIAYGRAAEAAEVARQSYEQMQELQQFIGSQFIDFFEGVVSGSGKASDALKNLVKQIANAALQASILGSGPLAGLFGSSSSTGGVGGLIGALFGGFRAGGGPVSPNKAFVVGENGPELFVPKVPGHVIPNGAGGGISVSVPVSISADGADPQQLARLTAEVRKLQVELPSRVVTAVRNANKSNVSLT